MSTDRRALLLLFISIFGFGIGGLIPTLQAEEEEARSWTFTPLPLAFYTSDTGIAGGALLVAERGKMRAVPYPRVLYSNGTAGLPWSFPATAATWN